MEGVENAWIASWNLATFLQIACPCQAEGSTTEEDKFFSRILELTKKAASSRQGSDVMSKKNIFFLNYFAVVIYQIGNDLKFNNLFQSWVNFYFGGSGINGASFQYIINLFSHP